VRFKLYFKTKGHLVVVHPLLLNTLLLLAAQVAVTLQTQVAQVAVAVQAGFVLLLGLLFLLGLR
jgi:hypothetical protein